MDEVLSSTEEFVIEPSLGCCCQCIDLIRPAILPMLPEIHEITEFRLELSSGCCCEGSCLDLEPDHQLPVDNDEIEPIVELSSGCCCVGSYRAPLSDHQLPNSDGTDDELMLEESSTC